MQMMIVTYSSHNRSSEFRKWTTRANVKNLTNFAKRTDKLDG